MGPATMPRDRTVVLCDMPGRPPAAPGPGSSPGPARTTALPRAQRHRDSGGPPQRAVDLGGIDRYRTAVLYRSIPPRSTGGRRRAGVDGKARRAQGARPGSGGGPSLGTMALSSALWCGAGVGGSVRVGAGPGPTQGARGQAGARGGGGEPLQRSGGLPGMRPVVESVRTSPALCLPRYGSTSPSPLREASQGWGCGGRVPPLPPRPRAVRPAARRPLRRGRRCAAGAVAAAGDVFRIHGRVGSWVGDRYGMGHTGRPTVQLPRPSGWPGAGGPCPPTVRKRWRTPWPRPATAPRAARSRRW